MLNAQILSGYVALGSLRNLSELQFHILWKMGRVIIPTLWCCGKDYMSLYKQSAKTVKPYGYFHLNQLDDSDYDGGGYDYGCDDDNDGGHGDDDGSGDGNGADDGHCASFLEML